MHQQSSKDHFIEQIAYKRLGMSISDIIQTKNETDLIKQIKSQAQQNFQSEISKITQKGISTTEFKFFGSPVELTSLVQHPQSPSQTRIKNVLPVPDLQLYRQKANELQAKLTQQKLQKMQEKQRSFDQNVLERSQIQQEKLAQNSQKHVPKSPPQAVYRVPPRTSQEPSRKPVKPLTSPLVTRTGKWKEIEQQKRFQNDIKQQQIELQFAKIQEKKESELQKKIEMKKQNQIEFEQRRRNKLEQDTETQQQKIQQIQHQEKLHKQGLQQLREQQLELFEKRADHAKILQQKLIETTKQFKEQERRNQEHFGEKMRTREQLFEKAQQANFDATMSMKARNDEKAEKMKLAKQQLDARESYKNELKRLEMEEKLKEIGQFVVQKRSPVRVERKKTGQEHRKMTSVNDDKIMQIRKDFEEREREIGKRMLVVSLEERVQMIQALTEERKGVNQLIKQLNDSNFKKTMM